MLTNLFMFSGQKLSAVPNHLANQTKRYMTHVLYFNFVRAGKILHSLVKNLNNMWKLNWFSKLIYHIVGFDVRPWALKIVYPAAPTRSLAKCRQHEFNPKDRTSRRLIVNQVLPYKNLQVYLWCQWAFWDQAQTSHCFSTSPMGGCKKKTCGLQKWKKTVTVMCAYTCESKHYGISVNLYGQTHWNLCGIHYTKPCSKWLPICLEVK